MDKIYNAIMGLAVGDALGVPYEFRKRGTFTASGMTGHGTHGQRAGTWSDDTSLTLATMESLIRKNGVDPWDIMSNFTDWLFGNKFTAHGAVFDVGGTTREAITRFNEGSPPEECGCGDYEDNGNGSLMRILPLAFLPVSDRTVAEISALTHSHKLSKTACVLYIKIARGLLQGEDNISAVKGALDGMTLPKTFQRLWRLDKLTRNEVRSGGFVADTLEAALWCVVNSDSYSGCVLAAVNLGGDTDTTAAVAGGLAGIAFGDIPQKWIALTARMDYIGKLCEDFAEFVHGKRGESG